MIFPINSSGRLLDSRGLPVNGVLWVGEPFKDPQSYPIALFGSQGAVENPVAVVDGVADVYANIASPSMLLLDSFGRQVWYFAGGFVFDELLGDLPGGLPISTPIDTPNPDTPNPDVPVGTPYPPTVIDCKYVTWAGWVVRDDEGGVPSDEYMFDFLTTGANPKQYVSAGTLVELLDKMIARGVSADSFEPNNPVACEKVSTTPEDSDLGNLASRTYFEQGSYRLDSYDGVHLYKNGDRLVGLPMSGRGSVSVSVDFDYQYLGVGLSTPNPERNFMTSVTVEGLEYYHLNYGLRYGHHGGGFKIFDFSGRVSEVMAERYGLNGGYQRSDRASIEHSQIGFASDLPIYEGHYTATEKRFFLSRLFVRNGAFSYEVVDEFYWDFGGKFGGVYRLNDDEVGQVPFSTVFCVYRFLVRADGGFYDLPDEAWLSKDF